jgi:hypothetical protein
VARARVLATMRPRAGRRFEPVHEVELEPDALNAARSLPGAHRGLVVLRELTGPYGVPDLVAVVGPPALLRQRRRLRVPPLLNQVDAGVVAAASPRAARRPPTLARRVGWPEESVRRRLPGLVKSGALIPSGRESYVRPSALQPVGRLYAIETKVKDWRRALRQARTYALWCDSYVLVMPSLSSSSRSALLAEVAEDGAGLIIDGALDYATALGEAITRAKTLGLRAPRRCTTRSDLKPFGLAVPS